MKTTILTFVLTMVTLSLTMQLNAQKYLTKNGHIMFYSETPIETIEAHNRQVNAALDSETGDFVFKVLMKSFQFEKALMQEHFNENYVESHKFPNATFQGKVSNLDKIDFSQDGTHEATVEGDLTIHGVTQQVKEKGTFTLEGGVVKGFCKFNVKPADFDIKIPKAVMNNIAEVIEVTVDVELSKL